MKRIHQAATLILMTAFTVFVAAESYHMKDGKWRTAGLAKEKQEIGSASSGAANPMEEEILFHFMNH